MIPSQREKYNKQINNEKYRTFIKDLEIGYPKIPFRVAETPVFIPKALKEKLVAAGEEIIKLIKQPNFKDITSPSIPPEWSVPHENDHPHFLTFDFGICKSEADGLTPMLIEMQGFPSLYGFQHHMGKTFTTHFEIDSSVNYFLNGFNEEKYIQLLKEVIIGKHQPHEVALMDVDAPNQKTAIDFFVTQKMLGIKILALTDIKKVGKQLFYEENGKQIHLKRIYNRLIFDEVANNPEIFKTSFDPREELDIEWVTHPNWFYRISKYTMPFLDSEFVPETRFLNQIDSIPTDLENYVLKPLFSFAGMGVIIDVTEQDINAIADPENWILQKKVNYEPAVKSPSGGVKAEIRMMYLWPDDGEPQLCISLARLSRGKMIGVRYNADFDWVGGTIGFMEE
ncbi:hypothetical protein EV200_10377 [Pedobacter psychrotolerans]|uniref:Glutathionylspermidine synthase n=1 Tax=Pedobacter psychrotolerans TaxID=1843235 RepID=A0A4R2HFJ5_9SPHI|nr:hypothetical protein [Pedobacter psychrotolerans]TCO26747.1 hypothetical protein EV200_10377 [Pedobacter psychrotolerans]GGE56176.1 hypothetical protein GCM10011413_23210 [Pedobacter psychrotolerans]